MAEIAIEDHVYAFIAESIDEAVDGDALFEAELHDNIYRDIEKEFGVRIADCESDLAPNSGATEVLEFDGRLEIVTYARVTSADRANRQAARSKALSLAKAVAKLFLDDPTMNDRVNDSRVLRAARGWDSIRSTPYAVMSLPLIVNETGGAA